MNWLGDFNRLWRRFFPKRHTTSDNSAYQGRTSYQVQIRYRQNESHWEHTAGAFFYDQHDPFAVYLLFTDKHGDLVRLSFARDLLVTGLVKVSGEGAIRISPGSTHLSILFCDSTGEDDLEDELVISRSSVAFFLAKTSMLVPYGAEEQFVDIDASLNRLLARQHEQS